MTKGDMAVAALNAFLIQIHNIKNPTRFQRQQWRERLDNINDRLVRWLRNEDNLGVNWDQYPVARDWFTQN